MIVAAAVAHGAALLLERSEAVVKGGVSVTPNSVREGRTKEPFVVTTAGARFSASD